MTNSTVTMLTNASTRPASMAIALTLRAPIIVSVAQDTSWEKTKSLALTQTNVSIRHVAIIVQISQAGKLRDAKRARKLTLRPRLNDLSCTLFLCKFSFNCSCPEGMQLNSDSLTCDDVDECEIDSPCSHFCENTEKRFQFA